MTKYVRFFPHKIKSRAQKKYTTQTSWKLASGKSRDWVWAGSLFWGFSLWWILQLRNLQTRLGPEDCSKQGTQRMITAAQLLPFKWFKCRDLEILVVWFGKRDDSLGNLYANVFFICIYEFHLFHHSPIQKVHNLCNVNCMLGIVEKERPWERRMERKFHLK